MKQQNNNIEQLFKEKLQNFEASPGVNAWANVQAGISSGSAVGAASSASWVSTAVVGVVITAIAIGGFFLFQNEGEKKISTLEQTPSEESADPEQIVREQPATSKEIDINPTKSPSNENIVDAKSVEENSATSVESKVQKNERTSEDLTKSVDESNTTTANSEPVYEKTIDEIIAEHQQFIEEQEAANGSNPASQKTSNEIENTVNDAAPKASQTPEKTNSTSQAELIEAQRLENKKIADQVIFPNVFTPDNDGYNDIFKVVKEQSIAIDNIQIDIVAINGKIVGWSKGIYDGWDGRLPNGSLAPEGPYTYQAIIYIGDKEIPKTGSFTIER